MCCEDCINAEENGLAWNAKGSREEIFEAVDMQGTLKVNESVVSTQVDDKILKEREMH